MASIVELREMNADKLQEMLENNREEMFNLRFRNASAQLDDYSRLKTVRREIAQVETVLHMRQLAEDAAANQADVAKTLVDKSWQATTHFDYEESAWLVEFVDENGNDLASAAVDLNKKRPKGRKMQPELVTKFEIAG